tara:strand:- start:174 stop:1343 length:1170 start_codon:yes stop_codon:yes gene_type:complete
MISIFDIDMNIKSSFSETRKFTELICKPLQTEDYTPQSAVFASPPKWHIAHTTWFYEEIILKKFILDYKVFDSTFGYLFNSYYNALGDRIERHHRGLITRPSIQKIYKYRKYVDEHILSLLETNASEHLKNLIDLGINHEQQHQELLITDLKYTFSCNPLYPKFKKTNFIEDTNDDSGWIAIDEGLYNIGHNKKSFSFDNELPNYRVFLEPYNISKNLVTNGDFIKFLNDGGYENPKYWLDDGWTWINTKKINKPLYWKKSENQWNHYTLSGLQRINDDSILSHISFYEAQAYANWAGYRLPTEFEWEVASNQLNWGKRWEWTNSAYLPYPGFKTFEGEASEYNGKFMINLMVLRGASSATSKGHSRNTYRNFFSPDTQWQYSGIRLAQ